MKARNMMGKWVVAAGIVTLVAASGNAVASIFDDDEDATARSLRQVKVIRLESNGCTEGISAGLGERGYSVTMEPGPVDAVLDVSVRPTGRNLDDIPEFGGIGKKARYSATLRGTNDRVLFSTAGHEGSINMAELCGDIGDDIGDQMKAQKLG